LILYEFNKHGRGYFAVECLDCGIRFERQKRVYKKCGSPDLCRSCNRKKNNRENTKCNYCNSPCDKNASHCMPCSFVFRDRARVAYDIESRLPYTPIKYCPDCGVLLKRNMSERCASCHNIQQDQGKSRERTKFNASRAWGLVRTEAFERDDYRCRICMIRGSQVLHAHHLLSYTHFPDHRLNINNLVTLCESCHRDVHFGDDIGLKLQYIHDYYYL